MDSHVIENIGIEFRKFAASAYHPLSAVYNHDIQLALSQ